MLFVKPYHPGELKCNNWDYARILVGEVQLSQMLHIIIIHRYYYYYYY